MSFLGLILVTFSASAMVGGKAVLPTDPVASQLAQIATWSESHSSRTTNGNLISESSKNIVANCTATFVTEDLLLTAAHCITKPNTLKVNLSWQSLPPILFGGVGRMMNGDFTILDSRVPATGQDIALIKIDRKIFGRGLPLLARKPTVGEPILSYGFGKKTPVNIHARFSLDVAYPAALPLLAPQFFSEPFAKALSHGDFKSIDQPGDMTVLKKTGSGGHCYGDSGGPNFVKTKNGISIAGVTVQVIPSKKSWVCIHESAIVDVSSVQPWLNQAARDLGGQLRWIN